MSKRPAWSPQHERTRKQLQNDLDACHERNRRLEIELQGYRMEQGNRENAMREAIEQRNFYREIVISFTKLTR